MTTSTLITVILSSSVLSAFLTGLITFIVHNRSYRNDYYKELIKKRLQAYESVESLYGILDVVARDEDERKYHFFLTNQESINNFFISLTSALKQNSWISQDTTDLLVLLMSLINQIFKQIETTPLDSDDYIEFAKTHYEMIASLRNDLRTSMLKDFSNLHKINFNDLLLKKKDTKDKIMYQFDMKKRKYTKTTFNNKN
jgi:hypothetical protein